MENARKAAKRAQESTYEGVCTIIEYHSVRDEKTKLSEEKEVTIIENQPCKLSFEKLNTAAQTETATVISQGIKLFLDPEIQVNSGSKIIVTQNGVTEEYACSGKLAIYQTHQEVMLELFRGWA